MKKIYHVLLLGYFHLVPLFSQEIVDELVFAFKDHERMEAQRMILVGEVVSIEKAHTMEAPPGTDLNLDTRPDNVVVKVLNPKGIRLGQTLYLIEKDPNHKRYRNGAIVGEIKVRSIFDTTFFGKQLRGEGYTRLIEDRQVYVARLLDSADSEKAMAYKKKGDFHYYRNEVPEAMKHYRLAISFDSKLPEPHYALGKIYKNEKNGEFTMFGEYARAWEHRENFLELRERIQFYNDYMQEIQNLRDNANTSLVKRLKEILEDYYKLVGSKYEYELFSSYYHFKEYKSSENPEKQAYHLEKAQKHLENTKKFSKETLLYHELAILIANEDLGNWTVGRPITDRIQEALGKIKKHGRRYLLINPPGMPVPPSILDVLERLPE